MTDRETERGGERQEKKEDSPTDTNRGRDRDMEEKAHLLSRPPFDGNLFRGMESHTSCQLALSA